ncbi:electron transfer flavoprotein beta subunit [Sediminihabitans luteus]|uniref:Electron transfer flavoprotein subunit beta n=1 Tax=Sediminihabitans luteus TaxID=1138585 RepID=A0A2M9CDZ6_9CELL|nr:electron transfer flavoprotein subunit beta/FixA family protein [Sediminihabitans luteus]PJJ70098.1 electron transfer flavoprotein beta subunit [Sediminihabitans luteus]GIJ00118.1 electron transfer flavoprotein subunit beta [Sediminihabitans luteus]
MRIVVAVKYVPDIQSDRAFVDGRVERTSDDGTLNELDEHALEAALRIVEALPEDERAASEVVALTVAGEDADSALRKAFQLGVDRGVRVSDDAIAGSDYFGTARVLAAAVRALGADAPVDLVITGMAALDGLGSVVPVLLAAELDLPQLAIAGDLQVDAAARTATVTRELGHVTEVLEAPLPAVVSVTDHANDPRFPNFKLIMAARSKKVEAWSLADLDVDPATVGDAGARTRVVSAAPRPEKPEVELVVDKGEGGKALAEYLIRNELV